MPHPIFFDGIFDLGRAALSVLLMYGAMIALVRLTGKRSVAQFNNFDWVVIVAMGSLMASATLLDDVTLGETLLAMGLLFSLQWGLTRLVFAIPAVSRTVKAKPRLLVKDGQFLPDAMRRERVTEAEIRAAVRQSGHAALEEIKWVVLETDAELSVISRDTAERSGRSAMVDIAGC
ncbi:DUF421 domain-containing protein [Hyphobacterium marinum]|uniref:YetF domain-containing protein n=1 Tax=Hyphobacterium marinum TaxID=3116574 RepID=A0ABU7M1J7_9PROT|nr:YetF domain-containing protein [Hyphobacterium sp. Y6023]MEE2567684.1 YetF domain-containing protein [Hyphobacterium sp. Y6023]